MRAHMKYLLTLATFSLVFFPFTAKADIAPEPGYHYVTSCAYFDNLSDYPAYDVYATSNWRFGPSAVDARSSGDMNTDLTSDYGCGNTGAPFFAVKDSNQKNITHQTDDERGDWWDTLEENKKYFINATVTGTPRDFSDELVQGAMPDANRTASFVSVYHIDALTDSTFSVRLVGEAQYDEDGLLLSETTDGRTASGTTISSATGVLLVVIVLIGAGLLVVARRSGAKK